MTITLTALVIPVFCKHVIASTVRVECAGNFSADSAEMSSSRKLSGLTRARKNVTTKGLSLKTYMIKNAELAEALDKARAEISMKREVILSLKKERQEAMERIISLESRLRHLVSHHDTHKSLFETLTAADNMVKKAIDMLDIQKTASSVTSGGNALSPPTCSPIQPPLCSLSMHQHVSSTPTGVDCKSLHDIEIETDLPQLSLTEINLEQNTSTIDKSIADSVTDHYEPRPKRACTSFVQSYQEPSISSKLRRGDPHTTSFNYTSPMEHKAKKKNVHKLKQHSLRSGLSDITNKPT